MQLPMIKQRESRRGSIIWALIILVLLAACSNNTPTVAPQAQPATPGSSGGAYPKPGGAYPPPAPTPIVPSPYPSPK
ncbi:MAG: hypothetical protein HY326_10010 [Chloroflexi bacterium]|nr:hypothetical protein [Chloroflexota bacterium]